MRPSIAARASEWRARWRPIVPLLVAELILWLGFGALLPVLPLYVTENGVDLATLGLVIAAWPAARLVGEPFFGWLADRRSRKHLMVIGLVAAAVFTFLPLVVTGPAAFFVLRALTGLSAALYDPAARGYLIDATPPARRGEAFGLYAAAQMGGLLLGPTLGAVGAGLFGSIEFVFAFGAVSSLAGAIAIAVALHDLPLRSAAPGLGLAAATEWDSERLIVAGRAIEDALTSPRATPDMVPPSTLWNRLLVGAVVLQFGLLFTVGTSEVVWSLYLRSLGAGLDIIGLSFAAFGLPVLLLSPFGGRLADRRGVFGPIVAGAVVSALASFLYPSVGDPLLVIPVILFEGAAFAFSDPALFSVVARGSPIGRSSTAQGIFGAAGTIGFIVSSLAAGWLAEVDLRLPFYLTGVVILAMLAISLAISGPALRRGPAIRSDVPSETVTEATSSPMEPT